MVGEQARLAHILQQPETLLVAGAPRLGHRAQMAAVVLVEDIDGYPVEHPVGLHRIEVHELVAFAVPEAVSAQLAILLQRAGAGTVGDLLGIGRHVLGDQQPHQR